MKRPLAGKRSVAAWLICIGLCALLAVLAVCGFTLLRAGAARTRAAQCIKDLESPNNDVRFRAEQLLVKDMNHAAPVLMGALPSLDSRAQSLAIGALIRAGRLSDANLALRRFAEEHEQLRSGDAIDLAGGIAAIVAASRAVEWAVPLEVVGPWLRSPDADLRKAALAIVAQATDAAVLDAVLRAFSDPDGDVRAEAIRSANQIVHRKEPVQAEWQATLSRELVARYAAADGHLEEHELAAMTAALLPLLDGDTSASALQLLRQIVVRGDVLENTRAIAAIGILRDAAVPIDEILKLSEAERVRRALQLLK